MGTAPLLGFNPARKVGSGVNNASLTSYTIASGYATALGAGDPVKFTTDGTIILGSNSTSNLGVFAGCEYLDTNTQRLVYSTYWPASQTVTSGQTITAYVYDDPMCTFAVTADGTVAQVIPGNIYKMNLTVPSSSVRASQMTAAVTATAKGTLAVTGTNNAALTNLSNGDVFTIKSSVANVTGTITIVTNQTPAQLLALINAVAGLSASLDASNFLTVKATDGGNVITADGSGTPLADSGLLTTVGTTYATAGSTAAGAAAPGTAASGMVKVIKVLDALNNVLEVVITTQSLRGNGLD